MKKSYFLPAMIAVLLLIPAIAFCQSQQVYAGPDETICFEQQKNSTPKNGCYQLNGQVSVGYTALMWYTPDGMGFFDDEQSLNPCYYYSPFDPLQGSVILILAVAYKGAKSTLSDSLVLTFQNGPDADAGPDATIDEGQSLSLSGTASNYSSVFWTTSGDGFFDNPDNLNPYYTPGISDIINGSVQLCLHAHAIGVCVNEAGDCMDLYIQREPNVNAGPDATICAEDKNMNGSKGCHQLNGTATNYTFLMWTTSGDGYFDNEFTLNPVYCPGYSDIENGYAILALDVYEKGNASKSSDFMILTIQKSPTVDAGPDATICEGDVLNITASTASDYGAIQWYTWDGYGFFDPDNMVNTTYYPSGMDYMSACITLVIVAAPVSPCTAPAIDQMELCFQKPPLVDAGPDTTICEGDVFNITTVTASDYAEILWYTFDGTGTFFPDNALNAVYYPSLSDVAQGCVHLSVIASAINPCTMYATDEIELCFQKLPVANAGPNVTTCEGVAVQLNGTKQYSDDVYWDFAYMGMGDGTFNSQFQDNVIYTPGPEDNSRGYVPLVMIAFPKSPCFYPDIDYMMIYITPQPTIYAGDDATICEGDVFNITEATASEYNAILWYTMDGAGMFFPDNDINTVYYPSPMDVAQGCVHLNVIASGINPCVSATDEIELCFQKLPQVDAGPDAAISYGQSYNLSNATATYYSSLLWTTSGSGYFSPPSVLNPVYQPGPGDEGTTVTLCLTAYPIGLCTNIMMDCMELTIQSEPTVNAGPDATICEEGKNMNGSKGCHQLQGIATNYTSLMWTTSGDGTFDNPFVLNPVYCAGPNDIALGYSILTLSVNKKGAASSSSDFMILTIQKSPAVDAGPDATICEGDVFNITAATASDYATILWYTMDGSGMFFPDYDLNTVYYPSPMDVAQGCVHLNVIASAINPCTMYAMDEIELCFNRTEIEIVSGWSGISGYIQPTDPNVEVMFSPIINELVILYNFTGVYYPAESINTIGEWDVYSGYVVNLTENASLPFCGAEITNKTIILNQGWKLIPVLSPTPYNIQSLFAGVPGFDIAKDVAGSGVYWKDYGINTIGDVLPGKAYYVRMDAPGIIDYSLPQNKSASLNPINLQPLSTPWNEVISTPGSHLIAFNVTDNLIEVGDIIGGFTQESRCTGAVEITDPSVPFALILNGDDPYSSEKKGLEAGEFINYRLYRPSTSETFELTVTYDPQFDHSGQFTTNGLSAVTKVILTATSITSPSLQGLQIYPNPSAGTFTIDGLNNEINVRIFNALGDEIFSKEMNLPAKVDLSAQPKGIYFVGIETGNGVFFEKLVIN